MSSLLGDRILRLMYGAEAKASGRFPVMPAPCSIMPKATGIQQSPQIRGGF
jgi:hypothetical protein